MADAGYSFFIDWNGDGDYGDALENVTSRVLGLRSAVQINYGRDQARALSAIAPGETDLELNNDDQALSPENTASPLYGNIGPGKALLIQATYAGTTYDLFRGYLDDFTIDPGHDTRSVKVSAVDLLAKFGQVKVHTDLYPVATTGEAIGYLLDELGWPEAARDIDSGASVLRWWCADDEDGLAALAAIVEAEGPPAFAYIGADGNFVFRDRHHRLTRAASTSSQVTIDSGANGTEPSFSDMTYEIGWKDLINEIKAEVAEREPAFLDPIWSTDDTYTIQAGETLVIPIVATDPFYGAITPEEDTDFTVLSGTVSQVTITRTSGKSLELWILASTATVVSGIQIRGFAVPVARTLQVYVKDAASITDNDVRTMQDADIELANKNDMHSIARIIVGQRAQRVPIVTIKVNNGNALRLAQILNRDLSDRIHIVEPDETFLDHDFFIENIKHDIAQVGKDHAVLFGCERAPSTAGQTVTWFTFDSASKGFDDGAFSSVGLSLGTSLFILDDATQGRLDQGNGLGF